ncbi:MAG: hypothetical protein U0W24_16345 [Bacteroidales bacterium]
MKMEKVLIIIVLILGLNPLCSIAQSENKYGNKKEKYVANNLNYRDKNKLLKNKNKIKSLFIEYYNDSIFPNDFILQFTNLEELVVRSKIDFSRYKYLKIKEFEFLRIDTAKLKNIKYIKNLIIDGFNFGKFPVELSILSNLTSLSIHYTTLDSIPKEIVLFNHLKELNLIANCIVHVDSAICELQYLSSLNLAHNKLTSIPPALVKAIQIKDIDIGNGHGPISLFNYNHINFYDNNEVDKLRAMLYHSNVVIFLSDCNESNYVRQRLEPELFKKLI